MSFIITEVSTFTSGVLGPSNGDIADSTMFLNFIQPLTNRTLFLNNKTDLQWNSYVNFSAGTISVSDRVLPSTGWLPTGLAGIGTGCRYNGGGAWFWENESRGADLSLSGLIPSNATLTAFDITYETNAAYSFGDAVLSFSSRAITPSATVHATQQLFQSVGARTTTAMAFLPITLDPAREYFLSLQTTFVPGKLFAHYRVRANYTYNRNGDV